MTTVETILVIVGGVVVVLVLLALVLRPVMKTRRMRRNRADAREKLEESQRRIAEADSLRASAEEQAAGARRDRAEAELRAVRSEREARERLEEADRQQSEALKLRENAAQLDPSLDSSNRSDSYDADDEEYVESDSRRAR